MTRVLFSLDMMQALLLKKILLLLLLQHRSVKEYPSSFRTLKDKEYRVEDEDKNIFTCLICDIVLNSVQQLHSHLGGKPASKPHDIPTPLGSSYSIAMERARLKYIIPTVFDPEDT